MTTLIAMKGELFGDRRKLVNYMKHGIIGVRDESKIRKLPHCLYGVTGFEFSGVDDEASLVSKHFENVISLIATLDYFADRHFNKQKQATAVADKDSLLKFRINCRVILAIVGKAMAIELEDNRSGLIMLTRGRTFTAIDGIWNFAFHNDPMIVGSGTKLAAVLIDHNKPIDEIYHALRLSGCPTGTTFDKLTVVDDISRDYPRVWDSVFIARMCMRIKTIVRKQVVTGDLTEEYAKEHYELLTQIVATFLTMGKYKDDVPVIARRPVYDFESPASRRTKPWKTALEYTSYEC
jgi:hypothetical protein